jgi:hypothetical protein
MGLALANEILSRSVSAIAFPAASVEKSSPVEGQMGAVANPARTEARRRLRNR